MWKMQKHWSNSQNDGQHKISSLADYILWYIHTAVRSITWKHSVNAFVLNTLRSFSLSLSVSRSHRVRVTRSGCSSMFCCMYEIRSSCSAVRAFVCVICVYMGFYMRLEWMCVCTKYRSYRTLMCLNVWYSVTQPSAYFITHTNKSTQYIEIAATQLAHVVVILLGYCSLSVAFR